MTHPTYYGVWIKNPDYTPFRLNQKWFLEGFLINDVFIESYVLASGFTEGDLESCPQ